MKFRLVRSIGLQARNDESRDRTKGDFTLGLVSIEMNLSEQQPDMKEHRLLLRQNVTDLEREDLKEVS